MMKYRTLDHPMISMIRWDPERPAEWINDHVAMVHAISNVYLVAGDDGDVLINSGTEQQGARIREKFEELLDRPLDIRKLVFTQNHTDHIGGWQAFADPQTEILAQAMTRQLVGERRMLANFFTRRYTNVISALMAGANQQVGRPEILPDGMVSFDHDHEFTVSGRRFVIERLWSGETLDSIAIWLPAERTVFTGNWAGAIHGAMPNFYTARGDRQRSVPGWIAQCDALLAREPDMLITGHEQPISGKDRIRAELGKVRDAVRFLHDATVTGMDEGRTLSDMMAQIRLPAELELRDGRSPERWVVRAVYEEYAGWFRHERTSELYALPHSDIWPDIVEGLGGLGRVAAMASEALAAGNPERALHFIEMATHVAPENVPVRKVEIEVLETLANASGLHAFDLLGWLEGRIALARRAMGE